MFVVRRTRRGRLHRPTVDNVGSFQLIVGMRDPRMHACILDVWGCTIAMPSQSLKFRNTWDVPDFLVGLPPMFCTTTVPWLHFQADRRMKPQRERSDGVGGVRPGRLGNEGLLPVYDECWIVCIKIRNMHVQNVVRLMFPEISI